MKLLVFAALLIGTSHSHIVEAQSYYYPQTQRPAGGVDQPNAQFIRNQMDQQRRQVDVGNARLEQMNAIRTYELIYGERKP